MPNIDKVLGGIGILIFVYLLFNADKAGQVIGQISSAGTGIIKALQGRT
jgi:hypothetical protein